MIRTTIGNLLDNKLSRQHTRDCIVYIVRDNDVIFYIGKSEQDIVDRLLSHLGQGTFGWGGYSQLGQFVKENLPKALSWQVELMTSDDCLQALTASTGYECVVPSDGVAYLLIEQKLLPNGSRLAHRITADDAEGLECELISVYRPCLNIRCNPNPTPLPDKYRQTRRDTTWESIADLLEVD